MNKSTLAMIVTSVLLSSFAQLALKNGMGSEAVVAAGAKGPAALLQAAAASPGVWIGLALYFSNAIAWLLVLSRVDVSLAYPFVGIGFVVTSALAWALLGETPTPGRVAGCLVICAGVLILARGG